MRSLVNTPYQFCGMYCSYCFTLSGGGQSAFLTHPLISCYIYIYTYLMFTAA